MSRGRLRPLKFMSMRWYFSLGYLLERVASYLPFLKPIMPKRVELVVPLNLFDSIVAIFTADEVVT